MHGNAHPVAWLALSDRFGRVLQTPRSRPRCSRRCGPGDRVLWLRGFYEDYAARYDYAAADLRVALEVLADLEDGTVFRLPAPGEGCGASSPMRPSPVARRDGPSGSS